jgi:hypothetical protein
MMRNFGVARRVVLLVAGVMLLGLFGAVPSPWRYLTLVGLIPRGVALSGRCPVCVLAARKGGAP